MRIRCNSMWRQAVSRHVEDRKDEVRELTLHVPYVSLAALLTPPCGVEHAMHPITLWWVCTCRTLCQQKFDPSKLKLKICLSEKHFFLKKFILLLLPLLFCVHFSWWVDSKKASLQTALACYAVKDCSFVCKPQDRDKIWPRHWIFMWS